MSKHDDLLEIDPAVLAESVRSGKVNVPTPKESCLHILRGLVSYHERMTMGNHPELDGYLDALKFAITCVEETV